MNTEKNCPDISVIVPVYNVEEYLEECLNSFLRQGDVSLEVLIIDDGSTDTSGEIADSFAQDNEIFKVYHIENGGLGHARNVGVSLASGKYIYFVDSDDIVTENTLSNMYALAQRNGSELTICNVARFNTKRVWGSGIHKTTFENVDYVTHISKKPELVFDTTSWNKLILKDFYIRNGFSFPENILYEDIPVTIPMHIMANSVSIYNETGYLWRVRDGSTKSITQNSESMQNLIDRVKIMRMLDEFFANHVTDEKLIRTKEMKALTVDLNIFANSCSRVDEAPAIEMMKVINEYLDEAVSEETMSGIPVVLRQKYAYIRSYDYENLKKVCAYESNFYEDAPVDEVDGRLMVTLDDELFTIGDRDISDEIRKLPVRQYIDSVEQTKTTITIHAHIYKRRVSVPQKGMLNIRTYLYNPMTDEKYALDTEPEIISELTDSFGEVTDGATSITKKYNYDAVGYKTTIDIEKLIEMGVADGYYKLLVEYENKYYSGRILVRGAKKYILAKGNSKLISGDTILGLDFQYLEYIGFDFSRNNIFVQEMRTDENKLIYKLNEAVDEVFTLCSNEKIQLEPCGENEYVTDISAFSEDKDYSLFASRGGKTAPVLYEKKSLKLLETENRSVIFSSLNTRECSFRIENLLVNISELASDETTADIKISIKGRSAKTVSDCDRAVLYIKDVYTGTNTILGKGKCRLTEAGNVTARFKIDFSNEKVNKNLYESERQIFIKLYKDGEERFDTPVYSKDNIKASFRIGTLGVKLFRLKNGGLSAEFKAYWKDNENSKLKRKALIVNNYAEFLKEPINPRLVVFESMWGAKYSCNPRALYEYINRNYPEYECVWFFDEERMPVNGRARRVRRFSEEYYHCLATAKYLVNNVNFPDQFVKRKGQVMVQTMHGTPLKTFGLEITQEMTSQDKKDAFLKRVSTWNYLIVQGEFMKNKSFDCFRYNGKILKTGYPRTDSLFNMPSEEKEKIRRNLGIPEDKKIILYTPTWRVRNKFEMMLDLEKMRERLSDEYVLLIRIHYFSADGYKIPADNKFIFDVNKYSSVEELYQISDMLITDYSSVMFDYALLNKPMLFYLYDYEAYCTNLRGIYIDFRNEAPGPVLYTPGEVIDSIENIESETEKCRKKIQAFKEKFLTYENERSCERVFRKMFRPSKIGHYLFMRKYNKNK